MAQQLTLDKIEKVPELFYQRWWKSLMSQASVDEWSIAGIVAFSLFLVMLAFFLLSGRIWIKKTTFYTGLLVFVFMILSFVFAAKQHNNLVQDQDAIIFNPSVTVKSSPDQNSVDLFVIHEGTKVYILDRLGAWYEIKIDNGSVGWIPQDAAEVI
ncbi:MAG: SH3 domain-containing protein [Bacteroidales bacterium]|nr:SH3 domain-containing protein [Bacteroidales bacterium]